MLRRRGRKSTGLGGADKLAAMVAFYIHHPMRLALVMTAHALVLGTCQAQYDLGVGVGAYRQWLREVPSDDDHYYARFSDFEAPGLSASVFYREVCSAHVDLGMEIRFVRRSFTVNHGYGGLAGSDSEFLQADLDLLYLAITPEVRMDAKGSAVVRFGPMIGQRVGGRVSGSSYYQYAGTIESRSFQNAPPTMLRGDLRFLFGLGLRQVGTKSIGVALDMYLNMAVSSLLDGPGRNRGSDLGITIGIFRRSQGKPFTRLFSSKGKTAP